MRVSLKCEGVFRRDSIPERFGRREDLEALEESSIYNCTLMAVRRGDLWSTATRENTYQDYAAVFTLRFDPLTEDEIRERLSVIASDISFEDIPKPQQQGGNPVVDGVDGEPDFLGDQQDGAPVPGQSVDTVDDVSVQA